MDRRLLYLVPAGVLIVAGVMMCAEKQRPDELTRVRHGDAVERAAFDQVSLAEDSRLAWVVERGVAPRSVAGTVVREGQSVADALVTLHDLRTEHGAAEPVGTLTGADGRFAFEDRPPALSWLVVTSAPGTALAEPVVQLVDLRDPRPETPHASLTIELPPCPASAALLATVDGEPAADARVERLATPSPETGPVVIEAGPVGPDGRYQSCAGAGPWRVVAGERMATVDALPPLIAPPDGEPAPTPVELAPAGRAAGQLQGSDGKPVAGALVRLLTGDDAASRVVATAASDANGHFEIAPVLPGEYRVAADHPRYIMVPGAAFPALRVVVGAPETIELAMTRCRSVAGVVREDDQPVIGETIRIGRRTYLQEDGSFVLDCVPPGALPIHVSGFGRTAPAKLPADVDGADNLVVLVEPRD